MSDFDAITLTRGPYRITATAYGRAVASVIRTNWGWHMAYVGAGQRPEWHSYDTDDAAVRAVYVTAAVRLRRQP